MSLFILYYMLSCVCSVIHVDHRRGQNVVRTNLLKPVQMGNVWRPNIIKHCLVTKQADVEVSGQTFR